MYRVSPMNPWAVDAAGVRLLYDDGQLFLTGWATSLRSQVYWKQMERVKALPGWSSKMGPCGSRSKTEHEPVEIRTALELFKFRGLGRVASTVP